MSQDVQISDEEDDDQDLLGSYYPNILVADDNPVELNDLVSHISYLKGPDMKHQICDFADNGSELLEKYIERL